MVSCILEKSNKNALIPLLIIVLAVFGRGILLEYTDLIDPTEARYASVAQQMLLTDDWVTPKLPLPDGVSPYLGKPPLHFWLTALSYSIFEVDEWTARLPSLLSTILLLLVVYNFTAKARGPEIGLVAALVFLSSWMSFFVAGASVVDVTLSALVCTGILYLFKAFENSEVDRRDFLIATIFAALSFLTKGPVGPVLIAIPLLLWLALDKRLSQIKQIPWSSSALLFVLIVAPWFVMAELRNPGFTKYFFGTKILHVICSEIMGINTELGITIHMALLGSCSQLPICLGRSC